MKRHFGTPIRALLGTEVDQIIVARKAGEGLVLGTGIFEMCVLG